MAAIQASDWAEALQAEKCSSGRGSACSKMKVKLAALRQSADYQAASSPGHDLVPGKWTNLGKLLAAPELCELLAAAPLARLGGSVLLQFLDHMVRDSPEGVAALLEVRGIEGCFHTVGDVVPRRYPRRAPGKCFSRICC